MKASSTVTKITGMQQAWTKRFPSLQNSNMMPWIWRFPILSSTPSNSSSFSLTNKETTDSAGWIQNCHKQYDFENLRIPMSYGNHSYISNNHILPGLASPPQTTMTMVSATAGMLWRSCSAASSQATRQRCHHRVLGFSTARRVTWDIWSRLMLE